jgi:hypothetical protein
MRCAKIRRRIVARIEPDCFDLAEIGDGRLGARIGGAVARPDRLVIVRLIELLDAGAVVLTGDKMVEPLAGDQVAQPVGHLGVDGNRGRHRLRRGRGFGRLSRRSGRILLGLGRGVGLAIGLGRVLVRRRGHVLLGFGRGVGLGFGFGSVFGRVLVYRARFGSILPGLGLGRVLVRRRGAVFAGICRVRRRRDIFRRNRSRRRGIRRRNRRLDLLFGLLRHAGMTGQSQNQAEGGRRQQALKTNGLHHRLPRLKRAEWPILRAAYYLMHLSKLRFSQHGLHQH